MPSLHRRDFVALGTAGALAAALPRSAVAEAPAREVTLPDGTAAPALGMGSWHMAERSTPEAAQAAMKLGLSLRLTLIDTAEIYGSGRSEELIAPVIAGRRDEIFLVSKIWPTHAGSEASIEAALRASLKRLGTDHFDLYLLHAPGNADLKTVVATFEQLRARGLIRRWGVSNFSVPQMEALFSIEGGARCATNQVLYNLAARGVEADLIPWCNAHKMPIMAYSPLGAGGMAALLAEPALVKIADARGVTPAAVALAWAMRDGRTIALVESASSQHIREDAAATTLLLSESDIAALDTAFPPPRAE